MSADECAQKIYRLLQDALSHDSTVRSRAETALRDSEHRIDFFASLAMIATASDEDAQPEVRWLAAIVGKNATVRTWHRDRKSILTDDERNFVRETLLKALPEKNNMIAKTIAFWIANISRVDFPSQWPYLIDEISKAMDSEQETSVLNAVRTMDSVLEQLSSKRLYSDRKNLYRVAPQVFAVMFAQFNTHLQVLLGNNSPRPTSEFSYRIVEHCMRSFRRLIEYGCKTLDQLPLVPSLFERLVQLPDVFMRGALGGTEMQVKFSHMAAKLVRSTQEHHPICFQPFITAFTEVYYKTLLNFEHNKSADQVCYEGALFLRQMLTCTNYDINFSTIRQFKQGDVADPSPVTQPTADVCRSAILSFFNEQRVDKLIDSMITRTLVLSDKELEIWANDPEALVQEDDPAEYGTQCLRNECQMIFRTLLLRDKTRIVPMILKLVESIPVSNPKLLDSCYRLVGSCVEDVQGAFDFEVWLNGQIINILRAPPNLELGARIIQSRAAWLVGQFAEVLTRDARVIVTPLLVKLISQENGDRVVALTAAKALQSLVVDMGFNSSDFSPHLETCVLASFRLVQIAETAATKRNLIQLVTDIVERSQARFILPIVELTANGLPQLWGNNTSPTGSTPSSTLTENVNVTLEGAKGEENLLRAAIVNFLTRLFLKCGEEALKIPLMRERVLGIVDFAVDIGKGKGGLYMLEDGCELWTAVMSSALEYTEDLARLFPSMLRILNNDYNNLREVFRLMEEYALLGRDTFMKQFGGQILLVLQGVLENTKERGCLAAVDILDLLLQIFPKEGVRFLSDVLSVCLVKIMTSTEGQNLTAAYVGLLGRACLVNIEDVERLVIQGNEMAALCMVDMLVKNIDAVYKLYRRKLVVFAICGLASRYSTSKDIQSRIPHILNAVVQVLAEEQSRKNNVYSNDFNNFLARFGEGGDPDAGEVVKDSELPGHKRRQEVRSADVVRNIDLRQACLQMMQSLKMLGEQQYNAVIEATDGRILQQLETYVRQQGNVPSQ